MPDMSKHKTSKRSTADVWFVLVITGAASATLQMWHATHPGGTALLVAAIVGLVPPSAAIGLSHVVAGHKSATMLRLITFAVMLAVMAASASASAAVIRPIDGPVFAWVLALALDAAALGCVWVLLGDSDRKAAEASALRQAGLAVAEAQAVARDAVAEACGLRAELGAVRAQLETAQAAITRGASAPRKRAVSGGRKTAARKPATVDPAVAALAAELAEMDTDAAALALLAKDPDIPGTQLGLALGLSGARGRQIKAKLTAPSPETGPIERVQ
jgi:hypothetical protein